MTIAFMCTAVAIIVLLKSCTANNIHRAVLIFLPLVLSKTFLSFAMCGLETPLSWALLGVFFYGCVHWPKRFYRLIVLAALCTITRFDNIIILAPTLIWMGYMQRESLRVGRTFIAASPLWLWCGFSLLYYGFVFPNTKYAKLNSGVNTGDLFLQGFHYLQIFFYYDTLAFTVICGALAFTFRRILSLYHHVNRHDENTYRTIMIGLGIALYVAYVHRIGGDFMAGRFFAVPFYLSVLLIYSELYRVGSFGVATALLLILTMVTMHHGVLLSNWQNVTDVHDHYGIVDERQFYLQTTGLFSQPGKIIRSDGTHEWVEQGKMAYADPAIPAHVIVKYCIGMYGYYADPRLIILDQLALADPLLARLPIPDAKHWRIGHFERAIPRGYINARMTGDLTGMPPQLALYYKKLRLITSGDLFSPSRLEAILGFQLGLYDNWKSNVTIPHPHY